MHSQFVVLGLAGLALSNPIGGYHGGGHGGFGQGNGFGHSGSFPSGTGHSSKGFSSAFTAANASPAFSSSSSIATSSAASSSSSVDACGSFSSFSASSVSSSYAPSRTSVALFLSSSSLVSSSASSSSYASSSTLVSSSTAGTSVSSEVVASISSVSSSVAVTPVSSEVVSSIVAVTSAAVTSAAAQSVAVDVPSSCTVTEFSAISDAVASCTAMVLSNIAAPESETIDLTDLQDGATVIFAGTTTFATTEDSDFNPIEISGNDITITAESDAIIDGNGQAYWDGEGSNGGTDKPDHFIVVKDVSGGSIEGLYIQNWPTHCFDITGCSDLTISNIILNNTAGDAPNDLSDGDPAAHNSDGFDISSSTNVVLQNSQVWNQDDCVAITSGDNIVVSGMYCSGGHGLSIGSVGGKSNNNVTNIVFTDSQVIDSENGCRIKSNYDTTGYIYNITYSNIYVSGISDYGIDIQQDYLNGGPTGDPSNGVTIDIVTFSNVTGTATDDAYDYYILCGDGSCSDFTFTDVSITGGGEASSCNYPDSGCPS